MPETQQERLRREDFERRQKESRMPMWFGNKPLEPTSKEVDQEAGIENIKRSLIQGQLYGWTVSDSLLIQYGLTRLTPQEIKEMKAENARKVLERPKKPSPQKKNKNLNSFYA